MTDMTVNNIVFTDESAKINWFNSEKANHWFNQWKFDWFRFREHRVLKDAVAENFSDFLLNNRRSYLNGRKNWTLFNES